MYVLDHESGHKWVRSKLKKGLSSDDIIEYLKKWTNINYVGNSLSGGKIGGSYFYQYVSRDTNRNKILY